MKVEDFAYAVVQQVFAELEHTHHFVIPEAIRKKVAEKVCSSLDALIKTEMRGSGRTAGQQSGKAISS